MAVGEYWYAGGPASVAQLLARQVSCVSLQVEGQNLSANDAYIQIFDALSVPAAGSVPLYSYLIPARLLFAKSLPGPDGIGRRMSQGLAVVWSTTSGTYTAPAAVVGPIYANGRDLASGGT